MEPAAVAPAPRKSGDVAAGGTEGHDAEKLLAEAQRQGALVLQYLVRKALTRKLAGGPQELRKTPWLFDETERDQLTEALAATNGTAELLGRARIRERLQRSYSGRRRYCMEGPNTGKPGPCPKAKVKPTKQPKAPRATIAETHEHIKGLLADPAKLTTVAAVADLATRLQGHTVADLKKIKADLGLKASGPKAVLVKALAAGILAKVPAIAPAKVPAIAPAVPETISPPIDMPAKPVAAPISSAELQEVKFFPSNQIKDYFTTSVTGNRSLSFHGDGKGSYDMLLGGPKGLERVGDFNALGTFRDVVGRIGKFIEEKSPQELTFSAYDAGLGKFYARLGARFAKLFPGYEMKESKIARVVSIVSKGFGMREFVIRKTGSLSESFAELPLVDRVNEAIAWATRDEDATLIQQEPEAVLAAIIDLLIAQAGDEDQSSVADTDEFCMEGPNTGKPGPCPSGIEQAKEISPAAKTAAETIKTSIGAGLRDHIHAIEVGRQVENYVVKATATERAAADGLTDRLVKIKKEQDVARKGRDLKQVNLLDKERVTLTKTKDAVEKAHRDAIDRSYLEIMVATREMGGTHPSVGSQEVAKHLEGAAKYIPAEWLKASAKMPLELRSVEGGVGGSCSSDGRFISATSVDSIRHEFLHRMQVVRPNIAKIQQAFFEARTAGEADTKYGPFVIKADKWPEPYMGTHTNGKSEELLTKCCDHFFTTGLTKDPELRKFFLGIMAGG